MSSYVIAGASRGIGLEFVRQLAENPSNTVFGLVRNKKTATKLLDLQTAHSNVHVFEADMVDFKALKAAAQEVSRVTGGALDVLIINGAYFREETLFKSILDFEGNEDFLEQDLIQSFSTNVIGVIHTTNAFLPLLRKGTTKKIIAISTAAGDTDFVVAAKSTTGAAYAISKVGTNMAVTKFALALEEENFTVLAISPGLVNTSQAPPTPEAMVHVTKMIASFKRAAPDWNGLPIQPEESVQRVLKVIGDATPADTGAFVSHFGNKQWL